MGFPQFWIHRLFLCFFPPVFTDEDRNQPAKKSHTASKQTDQQSNQAAVAPVITAASPTSGDAADPGIEMVNRLLETAIC